MYHFPGKSHEVPSATAAAPVAGEFRSCDYTGALAAESVVKVS